jgi:hypothetical protein
VDHMVITIGGVSEVPMGEVHGSEEIADQGRLNGVALLGTGDGGSGVPASVRSHHPC